MLIKEIEERLALYHDNYLDKNLLSAKAVKAVRVLENDVQVDLSFGYVLAGAKEAMQNALEAHLAPFLSGKKLTLSLKSTIDTHVGKQGVEALPQIKNIIAVASGKGGVGKSTIAVNLALALQHEGANVGLLDADIYGPSQPTMLGAAGERPVIEEKRIHPIIRHGLQTMSIGYLVEPQASLAWRGPMLGKALEQLLYDTKWQGLDYLVVDLPPGTGDVQLTLCQKMPVSGAIIVTTPQDLALLDVRRACEMFNKLSIPMLGVVENMSVYRCSHCGAEDTIFGQGGAEQLAHDYHLSLLGAIPLDRQIREMTDSGEPPVAGQPQSEYAQIFYEIARKVSAKLALQPKDYSARFPKVVVK